MGDCYSFLSFAPPNNNMPPKRKGRKNLPEPSKIEFSTLTNISALSNWANCKLPQELIVSNILTRLPVKSLARFKCVCKPWRTLFSTPKFIAMHIDKTLDNPRNHSLIIHSIDESFYHNMSVLNVNSTEKEPVKVVNPFPVIFYQMDLVGSINGLVCLSCPPLGQMIILWNPAMNLWKGISLSKFKFTDLGEEPGVFSLGLGYDASIEDYKIVRIGRYKPLGDGPKKFLRSCAEVYSVKKDSWKKVRLGFQFIVSQTRANVIAKGMPYWTAFIAAESDKTKFCEVLLWFDVKNDVFKHVPVPGFTGHSGTGARLVEWKGCLASLVYSPSKEKDDYVDVLVYDEVKGCWEKRSSHGPIGLKMHRHMQCSKDGVILAETPEGTLFLYDPATNGIKEFYISEAQKTSFEAFSYIESLVCVEGMEQVKEPDKDKFCCSMDDLVIN